MAPGGPRFNSHLGIGMSRYRKLDVHFLSRETKNKECMSILLAYALRG